MTALDPRTDAASGRARGFSALSERQGRVVALLARRLAQIPLVLFAVSVLLARRSRIAVWAALPAALAGCQLASHFLEQLLLHYQPIV